MKTRKTRLGLTRFTSFDNQTGSSDGTDKCASSSASYFRAFSSFLTLLLPSWHPDLTVGVWERRAARRANCEATRRVVKKNCPTKTGRQRERNVVNSQRKRLEAYRSGLSRRRLALSKPLDFGSTETLMTHPPNEHATFIKTRDDDDKSEEEKYNGRNVVVVTFLAMDGQNAVVIWSKRISSSKPLLLLVASSVGRFHGHSIERVFFGSQQKVDKKNDKKKRTKKLSLFLGGGRGAFFFSSLSEAFFLAAPDAPFFSSFHFTLSSLSHSLSRAALIQQKERDDDDDDDDGSSNERNRGR